MDTPDESLASALAAGLDPEMVHAYAQFAIRTRSPLARRVLGAAGEHAARGRVIALSGEPDAYRHGLTALDAVVAEHGIESLSDGVLTTWAQLLLRHDRDDELAALLAEPDLGFSAIGRWALRTDLLNPHRTATAQHRAVGSGPATTEEQWLGVFNEVYAEDDLEPIRLRADEGGDPPFRRLTAPVTDHVDGELVTVVMSAYNPDRDLLMAVRSVLEQSWRNLELLIVDDASTADAHAILDEAEALDPRVRVVRAPHNRGTYEARNLALSIARGRWITFHDSDDWAHPRRVELQVRHLLDSPTVLANRTWTLRAYADLSMTFVGYPARRLNASSLLFDRVQVTQLIGGFDATRKSGDIELPLRLTAVRPGSLHDLLHPAPLAITQLRSGSLSRGDSLPGWIRWDRLTYRDSYREWHRQITARRMSPVLPTSSGRPFPLPRPSWAPDRASTDDTTQWDVVVLGDLRWKADGARRSLGVARTAAQSGLRTAMAHGEAHRPLSGKLSVLVSGLAEDMRLGHLGVTDLHEEDECDLLVVTEPASLLHLDRAHLQVREILIVADEPVPDGWSVATLDRRCQDLFGALPRWGGPDLAHGSTDAASPVRRGVPHDRWCDTDLSVVTGGEWMRVGPLTAPRPLDRRRMGTLLRSTVVMGHHVADSPRRWPTSAQEIHAAYPDELVLSPDGATTPAELHGLQGLNTPRTVLELDMRPPTWVSFAGKNLTPREFLSHIDVWVYFGQWDTIAQIAALEALAAGLPCVLGPEAAVSALQGPVRCVPPERAREAMEDLLSQPQTERSSAELRQADWSRALHQLLPSDRLEFSTVS